jgi:O-antigen ligase
MGKNHVRLFISLIFLCGLLWLTLFFPSMYDSYQLPKAAGIFIAGVASLLAIIFMRGPVSLSMPPVFAGAFYLYSTANLIFSKNHPAFYYGLLFFSPLFFFTAFYSDFSPKKTSLFINILLFIPLITGILQFVFSGMARPYSLFGNPIFFGEFTAALIPVVIFTLFYPGTLRLAAVINLSLAVPVLIMCSSRGVLISLVAALAVFAILFSALGRRFSFNKKYAAAAALILAIIFFIPGFSGAVKNAVLRSAGAFSTANSGVKDRQLLALCSYNIFIEHPLSGAGAGAIRRFTPEKEGMLLDKNEGFSYVTTSYSHNDYLQLLAEYGAAGLLLFIAFAFSIAANFGGAVSKMNPGESLFSSALFSSFVFFMCESFFNFPLFSFPSSALFFAVTGLIASISLKYKNPAPVKLPYFLRSAFALVFLVPAVFYTGLIKPGALASDFYLQGAMKGGSPAYDDFSRSISLEPDSFYPHVFCADYLSSSGFTSAAADEYGRALEYFPFSPDVLYNMGSISLYKKDYPIAEKYFNQALVYYPGFAAAHLGLFRVYSSMGRKSRAQASLETAVTLDPAVISGGKSILQEQSK